MKILLVNDDGIDHERIKITEQVLSQYGEVFVVAPRDPQSAKSASLSIFWGCEAKKIDDHHYAVAGTPADCIEFAECVCGTDFDLVVSGCNNGCNLAQDILYSGTCGAATQALLDGFKVIAFSMPFDCNINNLKTLIPVAMNYVNKYDLLSTDYYLNINFPSHISRRVKITKVQDKIKEELYIKEQHDDFYVIERKFEPLELDKTIDKVAVCSGYISITPMSTNNFKNELYDIVKAKTGK